MMIPTGQRQATNQPNCQGLWLHKLIVAFRKIKSVVARSKSPSRSFQMHGIDHQDQVMKNALNYELPGMDSLKQAVSEDTLDVFFGPHALHPYTKHIDEMFPRNPPLSQVASASPSPVSQSRSLTNDHDSRFLAKRVCLLAVFLKSIKCFHSSCWNLSVWGSSSLQTHPNSI